MQDRDGEKRHRLRPIQTARQSKIGDDDGEDFGVGGMRPKVHRGWLLLVATLSGSDASAQPAKALARAFSKVPASVSGKPTSVVAPKAPPRPGRARR